MGLFGRRDKPAKDAVERSARVIAMGPTAKGARQTGKLDVEYEFTLDVGGRETKHTCTVPHDRMPLLGDSLPVLVSESEPDRLSIDFDRVPSIADRARASAEAAQKGDAEGAARALGFEPRDPAGG